MIQDIIQTKEKLDQQLKTALSTMEHKDTVKKIRAAITENQKRCPHFDNNYNWAIVDDICPYCGFHFATGGHVS